MLLQQRLHVFPCLALADSVPALRHVCTYIRSRCSSRYPWCRPCCRPPPPQAPPATQWQVDAAVLRLHSRRTTCLEFHPTLVGGGGGARAQAAACVCPPCRPALPPECADFF